MIQFSGQYQFYIVMSNSTAPSYETGDIVLLDKQLDFKNYKVGDAVLYSPPDFGKTIIHRIYDIKEINSSYYFAIKGDSNPQPDSVPIQGNVTNVVYENVSINWDEFYGPNSNTTIANFVVVSYFLANQYVFGRVIYRIPSFGWLFVPFQSPFKDPFNIVPFSIFSIFTIYYACLLVAIVYFLMRFANLELKNVIYTMVSSPILNPIPKRIKIPKIYTLIFYPSLYFILIFFFAIPTNIEARDISLQSMDQKSANGIDFTELIYTDNLSLNSAKLINNQSTLIFNIWNDTNLVYINVTQMHSNYINDLNTGVEIYDDYNETYTLTLNKQSYYVISSTQNNSKEIGQLFEYGIPLPSNSNPTGLMTNNLFLKSTNSTFNNTTTYKTNLTFNFIQDLMIYNINETAHFARGTGYLINYVERIDVTPWRIPELLGIFILSIGSAIIYEVIRNDLQKRFDQKYKNLFNESQRTSSTSTRPITEDGTNDEDDKDLSWEEYRKIEDRE